MFEISRIANRVPDVHVHIVQYENETRMLHVLINGRLITDPDHPMICSETSCAGTGLLHLDA
jgi:hypothetical protein